MFGDLYGRVLSWGKADKHRGIKAAAAGCLFVAGCFFLLTDYLRTFQETEGILVRNSHGGGSRTEELEIRIEGEEDRLPVEIEVEEQGYTKEEVQELFGGIISRMEKMILGENESLDRIEHDMELLTKVPGEPVEVSWELDRYDVMDIRGELQRERLSEEGTPVRLSAVLVYSGDKEEQAMYQCMARVFPEKLTGKEKKSSRVKAELQKKEEEKRTQREWKLPEKLLGKDAAYYRKMDSRGLVLVMMAVFIGVLLYAKEIQDREKDREKRKRQMALDYPEVVNKLTLFLGAGMTVKRAWKKIVEDYERQKDIWGKRYVYEEMKRTGYEMERGVAEAESYEEFGRRCGIQMYLRLGALLSQNLRKGTKGLAQLLRAEADQAFEERKARAKRMGEETGTKLLFPMFLMLAVVLVIVMVPAFLSVQI